MRLTAIIAIANDFAFLVDRALSEKEVRNGKSDERNATAIMCVISCEKPNGGRDKTSDLR